MDPARRDLAAEIHAAASEHDVAQADRLDNVISHAHQVEELVALMAAEPALTTTQVPVGAGLQLAVKR